MRNMTRETMTMLVTTRNKDATCALEPRAGKFARVVACEVRTVYMSTKREQEKKRTRKRENKKNENERIRKPYK